MALQLDMKHSALALGGSTTTRRSLPSKRGLQQQLIAILLVPGIGFLLTNQRIGWDDGEGPNWFAFILRSDVWFAAAIAVALVVTPKWVFWPCARWPAGRAVLLVGPAIYIVSFALATVLSLLNYAVGPDIFGIGDFVRAVETTCLGVLVFNLAQASRKLESLMVRVLTWSPLANIVVGFLALGVESFAGSFDLTSSERFVGLGSNPDIAMTQGIIAFSLLIPVILRPMARLSWSRQIILIYSVALIATILWTGMRAALVVVPLVCVIAIWLRFRPSYVSWRASFVRVTQIIALLIVAWIVASTFGVSGVLVDRLGGEDGRVFLWVYYSKILWENPFGLGMAFETIAGSSDILENQRLPPHNTLLQAAMTGGIIGIVASLYVFSKVARVVGRLRLSARPGMLSDELQGLVLAWYANLTCLMFAGCTFGDFDFAIVSGLLMSGAARSASEFGKSLRPETSTD